ncbi:hypothetical protein ACFL59_08360 [Planctomycetota bacterium]
MPESTKPPSRCVSLPNPTGWQRLGLMLLALALAAAIWLPAIHLLFSPSTRAVGAEPRMPALAQQLATRHLRLWTDRELRARTVARMRVSNAEWDFMGRTFLVLALANRSLRDPASATSNLQVMDRIIDETLRLEREQGLYFFLMTYAKCGRWVIDPPRSQFLDGEIALMLACRCAVADRGDYRTELKRRVEFMIAGMKQSPVLCVESYPDECWLFCNTIALAAIRIHDHISGEDHRVFLERWVETARERLTHPETGLLVSSCTVDGTHLDGPEGSSIWMVSHCLQLVDPELAAAQYARARRELGATVCGFGYAREWPASWRGPTDIDSGPIVPVLDVSAGSSGMALVAAAAFDDGEYLRSLVATLNFAAFPTVNEGGLRFCASNQVGDAVLLYALESGPLWKKVTRDGRQ